MKLTEYNLLPNTPGIYYIKNTKNGKGYVGQSQNIRIRVRRHINLFKRKVYDAPLYKAFDKYGLDAFEVEVLLSITDLVDKFEIKNKLDEAEIYYIDKLNTYTYNHKGYNQTIGGDAGITGYKYTDEQRQHISENSKRQAADGRFTIYCYDIINKEYITEVNTPALAIRLNISIDSRAIKRIIRKSQYILARSKEKLEEKINFFKENLNTKSSDGKKEKLKSKPSNGNKENLNSKSSDGRFKKDPRADEIIKDIKQGMSCATFMCKYNMCKKSYYNYKNEIFKK